jgi:tetratricopeptide (TPR) repeat protein
MAAKRSPSPRERGTPADGWASDALPGDAIAGAPAPSARPVPRRDYALWASWACGIAAAVLLAFGVVLYCAERARVAQPPRPSAAGAAADATATGPVVKSVIQLRQECDDLVTKHNARQVSVADFSRGVNRVIGDAQTLLANKDLPEANAIHAQKLVADGYGAIAEYQKEFTAYVAFAERLSRHHGVPTDASAERIPARVARGEALLQEALASKGDAYERSQQYLPALAYYAELVRRFPKSEHAAYGLYRTGSCYLSYDMPGEAEECRRVLMEEYAASQWGLLLLKEHADRLAGQARFRECAAVWERIGALEMDKDERCDALLCAAGMLARVKQYDRVQHLITVASVLTSDKERIGRALRFRAHVVEAECREDALKLANVLQ